MFGQYGDRFQTRPPPPAGQPPRYVFSRYIKGNLRPVIIGMGIIACAYALLWGGSSFSNLRSDKSQNLSPIIPFDLTVGVLYTAVALIEIFGVFGAVKQSLALVRLYTLLSLLVSVIIFGAEILRLVVHFKFKDLMIKECTSVVQTDNGESNNFFGFFNNNNAHNLSPDEASDFCKDSWSHNTFSDIAWLLASTICSLVIASLAISYSRQLLDPTYGVARARPRDNVPMDTFRNNGQFEEYTQGASLPYNAGQRSSHRPPSEYAPPYDSSKLPGYSGGYDAGEPDKKNVSDEDKDLAGVQH